MHEAPFTPKKRSHSRRNAAAYDAAGGGLRGASLPLGSIFTGGGCNLENRVLLWLKDKGDEKEEYIREILRESAVGESAWMESMEGSF